MTMKTTETGIWLAIVALGIVVVLLRSLYLYAPRSWQPRGAFAHALRYAPLAALIAIVVPEVLLPLLSVSPATTVGQTAGAGEPGGWLTALLDARIVSAIALLLAARWSGNLLVALGVGALALMLMP